MNHVITISREFGSGGRELGFRLAEKYKIPFYDKELISMAAEACDIAEEVIHEYDESISKLTEYTSYRPFSPIYQVPMSDQIFLAQSSIIRQLAEHGPCVIIGRCADMVLKDSINLFIYGNIKKRMERMISLSSNLDEEQIEARICMMDKKRKEYYQYYTGNIWGKAQNYHLCLDSGKAGIDVCLETVICYLEHYQ